MLLLFRAAPIYWAGTVRCNERPVYKGVGANCESDRPDPMQANRIDKNGRARVPLTNEHLACTNVHMLFGDGIRSTATSAEGRRREILVAALNVIAEGGADAVTHRRVAAKAGVPLGSLTYYFDSREELIREAFRLYIDEATEFVLGVEREIPPTSVADLVDLIVEIMRREFMQPEMVRAEYELILHASGDEQVARAYAGWERVLESRLSAPLEALGAIRPIAAARTILHLVRGFELEQIAHRTEDAAEFRDRLKAVLDALVGAREKDTERSASRANQSHHVRGRRQRHANEKKHSNHRRTLS